MRFAGIHIASENHVVAVVDDEGKTVLEARALRRRRGGLPEAPRAAGRCERLQGRGSGTASAEPLCCAGRGRLRDCAAQPGPDQPVRAGGARAYQDRRHRRSRHRSVCAAEAPGADPPARQRHRRAARASAIRADRVVQEMETRRVACTAWFFFLDLRSPSSPGT